MTDIAFLLAGLLLGAALSLLVFRARAGRSSAPASRDADPPPHPDPAGGEDLVEEALDRLSEGVIVFNDLLRPVLANIAARRLLQLDNLPGAPVEILSIARRAAIGPELVDEVVDARVPERVSLRVRAVPLEKHEGVIVTLTDVTGEEEIQRVRRQFVTHASHELKSPAASIQALAEAILDASGDDPDRVGQFALRLRDETERLSRLVDDLLDLSRVEDPASFTDATADLGAVAEAEVDAARRTASEKGVEMTIAMEADAIVRGDKKQLGLLVRNLLENAIRYTPSGGSVHVDVKNQNGESVLRVSDTGIGIPLRSQARVFERFYRVDEARSREHGGTGLGLAIVKHVADLHGGSVEVDSVYGEGSTFTARFPALAMPRERSAS